MHQMKSPTVRDLRYSFQISAYSFKEVEAQFAEGEEIEMVKRKKVIARLVPVMPAPCRCRILSPVMKAIHGDVILEPSNAELIAEERDRF